MCQEMPLYSVLCKEDIFIKTDWQSEAMGNCLQRGNSVCLFISYRLGLGSHDLQKLFSFCVDIVIKQNKF